MKMVNCWDIHQWYGGDFYNHKFYVSNEHIAEDWVKIYQYDKFYSKELIIFESIQEIKDYLNGELRKSALAKLTPEEKMALGIKSEFD